jgi:hypothetical protein
MVNETGWHALLASKGLSEAANALSFFKGTVF